MAQTAHRQIKALRPDALNAFRASVSDRLARRILKFSLRAPKSVLFRARKIFGLENVRLLKRNVVFPLRNALLHGRPLALRAGGQSFVLLPEGAVPLEIWSRRYFERHELDFILSVLQPGMTFLDVGANVGVFSIPAAKKVRSGRVIAFEPSAWTVERLAKNTALNQLCNLLAVHSAVGDYTGDAILQLNVTGKDGLNTIGKAVHQDSEIVATEKVQITTLDHFLQQHSISAVHVMKVDVEGAELMVFRGAKNLLARPDAPLLLYESACLTKGFGYHLVESMWFLEQYDYRFFMIDAAKGRITPLTRLPPRDTMVIAAKPGHPSYTSLQETGR